MVGIDRWVNGLDAWGVRQVYRIANKKTHLETPTLNIYYVKTQTSGYTFFLVWSGGEKKRYFIILPKPTITKVKT